MLDFSGDHFVDVGRSPALIYSVNEKKKNTSASLEKFKLAEMMKISQ